MVFFLPFFESFEHEDNKEMDPPLLCNKSDETILTEVYYTQMNEGNTVQKMMNALLQTNLEEKTLEPLSALSETLNVASIASKKKEKKTALWQRCKSSYIES